MKILRPETAHLGKAFAEPNGEKDNVHKIDLDGKTVVLIGTAHVSGKSTDLVRRIIELVTSTSGFLTCSRGVYNGHDISTLAIFESG